MPSFELSVSLATIYYIIILAYYVYISFCFPLDSVLDLR